ncbi:MAG TPA: peptidylprolyl isomerase [Paludibaculum sp.]|jgi:peptidyl-prolyl cis-trans isomerase A (cyclophilin A)
MPEITKVKFETTKGDFVVEVNKDWAPLGVERFLSLVGAGYFDAAKFFRVLPGFVVQFGLAADPNAAVTVSTDNIKDDKVIESNLKGTITFATAGPNTRTTQLFINLGDNPRLDGMGFSPFGKVIEGMDVVEQLYSGYGEGAPHGNGPDQGRIRRSGNSYLNESFPKLDAINKASVIE